MKKFFETPELAVTKLVPTDVITTSSCTTEQTDAPCQFDGGGF